MSILACKNSRIFVPTLYFLGGDRFFLLKGLLLLFPLKAFHARVVEGKKELKHVSIGMHRGWGRC